LNNSVNKIHPIILYSSLYYLLYNVFFTKQIYNYNHLNFNFIKFTFTVSINFIYLSFTLFLGGWWAYQEGSWGGWWDWDVSEVFGLFLWVILIKSFHKNLLIITLYRFYLTLLTYIMYLLLFYFFMQLNFSLISHNFNLNSSSNFISNIYYLFYIFSITIILILILFNYKIFLNVSSLIFIFNYNFKYYWTLKILIFIFSNTIILFSLFPILSSWIWSNLSIEYSFSIINFHNIIILMFIILLTLHWNLDILNLFLLFIFLYNSVVELIIVNSLIFFYYQHLIHYFIFWLIAITWIYSFAESSYWSYLNYGFNYYACYFYNSLKIDSPFLNYCKDFFNQNLFKNKNFNWWYDFSSLDFKTFVLSFSNSNSFQVFVHDVHDNSFVTIVSSLLENSILNCLLLVLILFLLKHYKKSMIVF
jgi:cytochrome c biogenesis factor